MSDDSSKTKALAAGGLALGLAGSGGVAGDTNAQQAQQQTQRQDGLQGLVFVNDFNPAIGFQIVSRIQQPTVNQILGYVNPASPNEGDGAVVDPTDWNGYIFNYVGCGPGNYNLLFVREGTLQQGQTYSFSTDAVYFSNRLQLLESVIQVGGAQQTEAGAQQTEAGGQQTEEGAQGVEGQTTTPEETTTPAGETTTPAETTPAETTTPPDETATAAQTETTTEANETTESVIVNATETDDGG